MKRRRIAALLLAFTLLAGLLSGMAVAAGTPKVRLSQQTSDRRQSVSLTELPGDCYGVQLTLTLDSDQATADFLFDAGVSGVGSYCTYKQEGAAVTLYLTSKSSLNRGGSLTLGTLTADRAYAVKSVSNLKLLDLSELSAPLYESAQVSWSVAAPAAGGISGGQTQPEKTYAVEVSSMVYGSVTASHARAAEGEEVSLAVKAEEGYRLSGLIVADSQGLAVAVRELGEEHRFRMPASDVKISASFVPEKKPVEPLHFTDVEQGVWFYPAVDYVYRTGIMQGTGETTFSPDSYATRGVIVTVLYRFDGAVWQGGASSFQDVAPGDFYADAVAWAAANGIVSGYSSERFGPGDPVTREQLAAILHRYARYKGYAVSARADLSIFVDREKISPYAEESLAWARAEALMNGVNTATLAPDGLATRAQAAQLLMNFSEWTVK